MPSSAWKKDVCSRSEEHTSELQSLTNLVCRLLLEKKPLTFGVGLVFLLYCLVSVVRIVEYFVRAHVETNYLHSGLFDALMLVFFFNDTATTEIYTLSLHDALPISRLCPSPPLRTMGPIFRSPPCCLPDRKSTRLNSSHDQISYAVFCLTKRLF